MYAFGAGSGDRLVQRAFYGGMLVAEQVLRLLFSVRAAED